MFEGLTWAAARTAAGGFIGRNWEIILIVALFGGGCWYLDHRGYERAQEQNRARENERALISAAVVRSIDAELDGKLAKISSAANGRIQTITTEGKTVVQPIITRELLRDPRLADPNRCLSPGLLSAINAARGYLDQELTDGGAAARSASAGAVQGSGKSH